MPCRPTPLFAAAIGLVAGTSALAGVQITMENQNTADGKTTTSTIAMGPAGLRVDMAKHTILFQSDQSKAYMLDTADQTYVDLTEIRQRINAQMEQRMAGMPPEQRQRMEAMMAQHGGAPMAGGGASADAKLSYAKGESKKVGPWNCTVYHESRNGEHVMDACIATLGEVGLTEADIAAYKAYGEAMRKSFVGPRAQPPTQGSVAGRFDLDGQTAAIGYVGLPVEITVFSGDKASEIITMKAIDRKDVAASQFQIPAGYTPRQIGPGTMQGGPAMQGPAMQGGPAGPRGGQQP
jgi:hypothetical protein